MTLVASAISLRKQASPAIRLAIAAINSPAMVLERFSLPESEHGGK